MIFSSLPFLSYLHCLTCPNTVILTAIIEVPLLDLDWASVSYFGLAFNHCLFVVCIPYSPGKMKVHSCQCSPLPSKASYYHCTRGGDVIDLLTLFQTSVTDIISFDPMYHQREQWRKIICSCLCFSLFQLYAHKFHQGYRLKKLLSVRLGWRHSSGRVYNWKATQRAQAKANSLWS